MPGKRSSPIGQLPLVRQLGDLGLAAYGPGKRVFSERLADMIDISEALSLSEFFARFDAIGRKPEVTSENAAWAVIEQHSAAMRASIDASFLPLRSSTPAANRKVLRLPKPEENMLADPEASARYRRFYRLHQSEFEWRIAQLKPVLLHSVSSSSDALAQVAALEAVLEPILLKFSRQCLATMPELAVKRFERLCAQQREREKGSEDPSLWLEPGGWLATFHEELQRLLHAELKLRLQPLEGLADSCANDSPIQVTQ
jgi:hypothetical protein